MKKNPIYDKPKHIENCDDYYGTKVTAFFYVGDKIKEGEPFGVTEENAYIDDMGSEWHKGHMLAKSLGGDNKLHNLLPMKEDVNNSTFKKVENYVHTLIDNLADIQKLYNEGTLHIRYTVERVNDPIKEVKGHMFPGKFKYNIEIMKDENQSVDSILLWRVLKKLDILPEVSFSNTFSVG